LQKIFGAKRPAVSGILATRKISTKLFMISLASIILTASVILVPTLVGITRIINDTAREDIRRSMNTIQAVLYRMKRSTLGVSVLVAQDANVAAALRDGDGAKLLYTVTSIFEETVIFSDPQFVTITDSRGAVLFRRHREEAGDFIAYRRGVYRALGGLHTSDMEPDGESALAIVSTVPIFADGGVIGTVSVGYDMGQPDFVDYLQLMTNTEITIFAYDVSIMTTIVSAQTGERLYGVPIAPHIAEVVLGERRDFYMETEIAPRPGELFLAYYKPFLDATGEVLGLVFSGQNLTSVRYIERQTVLAALGFSALIIVLVFLVSRFANDRIIVKPVKRAIDAVTRLAEGDMRATDLAGHSGDELGVLLSGTQKMANAIKTAMGREREAHETTQKMLETSPMFIEVWDDGRNMIDCNRRIFGVFGFADKEEYMDRYEETWPELQPCGKPSREMADECALRILREGVFGYEWTYQMPNGEPVPVEVTGVRMERDDGPIIVKYCHDLRPIKAAMERERELETRLSEQKMNDRIKLVFDAAPLFIQYWDGDFNAIDCNKNTLDFYGFAGKDEYRNDFHATVPSFQPDGVPSVEYWNERLREIFENGFCRFEFMDRNLKGDFVFTAVDGIRLDYNGATIVITYGKDITGLKEANELNQVILDSAPFVISLWDDGYRLLTASKKAAQMFEIADPQELAKRFYDFSPELQPDGTPSREKALEDVGRAYREGYSRFEWMHVTANGEPLPSEAICKRFTHKGRVMLVSYSMDLREIKAAEAKIAEASHQLEDALEQALSASRAKSAFLSIMSHEIRTPMNAITGMAELLLRGELPGESRGYAQDIKQAGANLLSIINDLLDFSKIEAGKLEIIPAKYMLASLIHDVVSIIRMRLVEKPIRFYSNIDGTIPNTLVGDEVRLRQILLNLLSNAVKFTDRGVIGFSITQEERTDERVRLKIAVTDTGHGIKPEDQKKLFGEFVQVDTKKNRATEGTGLGLAIVKKLCTAMGGSIEVESEYGRGSSFTVRLPQEIGSPEPFAAVENAEKKKVLVYERRAIYAKSICWSLENMNVPYTIVESTEAFTDALFREDWYFVFTGYGLYGEIKRAMDLPDSAFPGGKPSLALMIEWDVEARIPNSRFVSIPVQSLSIANVLNGREDRQEYYENADTIQYAYPEARLLVVDDISTNLKVVEGLLVPYKAAVDTCLGGAEAVELTAQRDYDIVFMDHMMPEMDGIEATAIIRDREREAGNGKAVNIVALTANAVSGMRELFIEKGFNDFLAKPIDVSKLDKILELWIPAEKRERAKEQGHENAGPGREAGAGVPALPAIPGVDTAKGMAGTGGTPDGYRRVLSVFHRDAKERLPLLQAVPDAQTLPEFVTGVHALKSACASLGARELSAEAAGLEAAGKAGDFGFILENLGAFAQNLAELAENIGAALELHEAWGSPPPEPGPEAQADDAERPKLLRGLVEALKSQNVSETDRILDALGERRLDSGTRETLENVSDCVLMADFKGALKIAEGLAAANG